MRALMLALLLQGPAVPVLQQNVGGPPALRAECVPARGGQAAVIRLTLSNRGDDTTVNVGIVLGNGAVFIPSAVGVALPDARPGTDGVFNYTDPVHAAIAGRVDPWLVPLVPGASYQLELLADRFWSAGTFHHFAGTPSAQVSWTMSPMNFVNGDMPGLRLWRLWTGRLEAPLENPECR